MSGVSSEYNDNILLENLKDCTNIELPYFASAGFITTSANDTTGADLVIIENTIDDIDSNLLKISFSEASDSLSPGQNFIEFLSDSSLGTVSLGSIEGNESEGVSFTSPQADYAEYLPKLNPDEIIKPGDVVGVFGGKVSLKTDQAERIMVVSTAPIIGNWPGHDKEDEFALIAFLGQVDVQVNGSVEGDYLIPSGDNDGSAIAISKDEITVDQLPLILGS